VKYASWTRPPISYSSLGVVVMLDARPQQSVEILAREEEILELVEAGHRRGPVSLELRVRKIEGRQQHRLGRRDVRAAGTRHEYGARAGRSHQHANAAEQAGQMRAHPRGIEMRVCLRDSRAT
jgi:hypothetical protein